MYIKFLGKSNIFQGSMWLILKSFSCRLQIEHFHKLVIAAEISAICQKKVRYFPCSMNVDVIVYSCICSYSLWSLPLQHDVAQHCPVLLHIQAK